MAANILANTRTGVLRACECRSTVDRYDRTWGRTVLTEPASPTLDGVRAQRTGRSSRAVIDLGSAGEEELSAAEELGELLDWAQDTGVISDSERALLVCLLEAADRAGTVRACRVQGLLTNRASEAVADRLGISPVTVRRRTRRTVQALTDACAKQRCGGVTAKTGPAGLRRLR